MMKRRHIAQLGLGICSAVAVGGCMPSCELREPFQATVVAAGIDGAKVRSGIFALQNAYETEADGSKLNAELEVLESASGRVVFKVDAGGPRQMSFKPIQDASARLGGVVFTLPEPPPEATPELAIVSWFDANGDGKLDLDLDGESETARTIYRWEEDSDRKYYLWSYVYHDGSDPYYTATALGGPAMNYIVTEDSLTGWMALLTTEKEAPVAAE